MNDADALAQAVENLVDYLRERDARLDREEWARRFDARPISPKQFENPARLSLLVRAIPGLASRFRLVPAEHVSLGEEKRSAEVRCVCGETLTVPADDRMHPCPCGRVFIFVGEVWAARGEP